MNQVLRARMLKKDYIIFLFRHSNKKSGS